MTAFSSVATATKEQIPKTKDDWLGLFIVGLTLTGTVIGAKKLLDYYEEQNE